MSRKITINKAILLLIFTCLFLCSPISSSANTLFNKKELEKSAKNVCDYVAQAYRYSNGDAISSRKGFFISADGKKVNVRQGWDGSCGGTDIALVGMPPWRDASSYGFHIASGWSECSTVIDLIPFRGKYYTLSTENDVPVELTDPNKGKVCSFQSNKSKPYLIVDKNPDICKGMMAHSYPSNINWTPIANIKNGSANNEAGAAGGYASYDEVTTVKLGDKIVRFGHFTWTPTAAACIYSGIRAWNKGGRENGIYKSINDSIEDQLAECYDADADLKKINGDIYIEASGGIGYHHTLLKYENGKFNLICKTDPGNIYTYTSNFPESKK